MLQNIVSLAVLAGTGIALLGSCLVQAHGLTLFPLTGVAIFFGLGLWAHVRTMRKQG